MHLYETLFIKDFMIRNMIIYIYLSSFTASSDKPEAFFTNKLTNHSSDKPEAFLTNKLTNQPLGKNIREKDFDAIPIYCAALGAVVVGLLGYVIFKQYSRIRDKKRHKIHDPHEHVEYSRASGINDSGVFVESAVHCKTCKYYIKEGFWISLC